MSISNRLCAGAHCLKPASFSCPICIKEGRRNDYFFCDQNCFKSNWSLHKQLHLDPVTGKMAYRPWSMSSVPEKKTKGLIPFPVTPMATVPSHILKPDYADSGYPASEEELKKNNVILVLKDEEIKKMRTVCKLAREVLDIAGKAIQPGITTDEIDKIVFQACMERNAYPSPLNYHGFPKSCCTSVNEVICHGIPDLRPLEDGDIVNVDVTLYVDGFHGDLNETFLVGNVDEKYKKLIQVTKTCLERAIDIVRPGVQYKEIGNVIQKIASQNGFSVVKSYCGHGVNKVFHGPPTVPHYANNKAVGVMAQGHTFTIEPMICEGSPTDTHWPDDWTCLTKDGKRSAQYEHTLLVTERGCDILTL